MEYNGKYRSFLAALSKVTPTWKNATISALNLQFPHTTAQLIEEVLKKEKIDDKTVEGLIKTVEALKSENSKHNRNSSILLNFIIQNKDITLTKEQIDRIMDMLPLTLVDERIALLKRDDITFNQKATILQDLSTYKAITAPFVLSDYFQKDEKGADIASVYIDAPDLKSSTHKYAPYRYTNREEDLEYMRKKLENPIKSNVLLVHAALANPYLDDKTKLMAARNEEWDYTLVSEKMPDILERSCINLWKKERLGEIETGHPSTVLNLWFGRHIRHFTEEDILELLMGIRTSGIGERKLIPSAEYVDILNLIAAIRTEEVVMRELTNFYDNFPAEELVRNKDFNCNMAFFESVKDNLVSKKARIVLSHIIMNEEITNRRCIDEYLQYGFSQDIMMILMAPRIRETTYNSIEKQIKGFNNPICNVMLALREEMSTSAGQLDMEMQPFYEVCLMKLCQKDAGHLLYHFPFKDDFEYNDVYGSKEARKRIAAAVRNLSKREDLDKEHIKEIQSYLQKYTRQAKQWENLREEGFADIIKEEKTGKGYVDLRKYVYGSDEERSRIEQTVSQMSQKTLMFFKKIFLDSIVHEVSPHKRLDNVITVARCNDLYTTIMDRERELLSQEAQKKREEIFGKKENPSLDDGER